MRAELLNQVFKAVLQDYELLQLENIFSEAVQSIESWGNDSTRKNAEENFSDFFVELQKTLSISQTREFSPHWRSLMSEIKIDILLADNLATRLDDLSSQKMTVADFVNEVRSLFDQFQNCVNSIKLTASGFNRLGVGADIIARGDCELNFIVPRNGTVINLKKFIDDLQTINYHLATFSDLLGEEDRQFSIKNISSMDYSVVLDIDIDLGVLIVSTLEPLRESLQILDKKRALIEELNDLPKQILADIRTWSDSLIDKSIQDALTNLDPFLSILRENDAGRGQEITNRLKRALRDIAAFWDEGYFIEVRVASAEGTSVANKVPSSQSINLQALLEKMQTPATPLRDSLPETASQSDRGEPNSSDRLNSVEEVSRQNVGRWRSALRKAS